MVHSFRAAVAEARRHGDLYFAALLPQDRIHKAFGAARCALARLDLHACGDRMGLSLAMPQPRPFLPRCRGPADCLACGTRPEALFGRHRGLLHGAKRSAGRSPSRIGARHRQAGRGRIAGDLALARAKGPRGGRLHRSPCPTRRRIKRPIRRQKSQKPGCGFPIARILVIFSLSVGTVLEAAIGKYKGKQTGENSLFRQLYDALDEGDVILADRYFSGWCDIALPLQRGIDIVVRKHQLRRTDFRTGKRLGKDDHLVSWRRPQRPKWMSAEQYCACPTS